MKYVLILDNFSPELKEALDALYEYKKSKARRKIKDLENSDEKNFALGLYKLMNKDYSNALVFFQKIPKEKFNHQAALLVLDCKLELEMPADYYKEYQQIYDQVKDPVIKEIVQTRFKYYKHAIY